MRTAISPTARPCTPACHDPFTYGRLHPIAIEHRHRSVKPVEGAGRRETEDHFQTVVMALDSGVMIVDHRGRVAWANPAALRMLHTHADDLLGRYVCDRNGLALCDRDGRAIPTDQHPIAQTRLTRKPVGGRIVGVDRSDRQRVWLSMSCRVVEARDGQHSQVLVSLTDVTAQHTASLRLAHEAAHDSLTGLPNRAQVLDRVADALRAENQTELAAVMFIDLDNFKEINDSLGHEAGDSAIKIAAERLRHALRPGDLIARLGGDEFVALLTGPMTADDLDHLSDRLHTAVSEPMQICRQTVGIGASIGVAEVHRNEARSPAEILRDADLAMYRAKTTRRGKTCRFSEDLRVN